MRASSVLNFQASGIAQLKRPWQTFKDGQIWYGLTKLGTKRHPLTSKQGNKNFYKGTGSAGMGKLDNAGNFIVNWSKVRTYVVPSGLNQTTLNPLVSPEVPEIEQKFTGYADGPKDVELAWKNIKDFIEYGENYDYKDLEKTDYLEEFINPKVVQVSMELPDEIKK